MRAAFELNDTYLGDYWRINRVDVHADPPIIPEVRVIEFKSRPQLPDPDRAIVVVRVPESDIGSHAVDNRTTVYLRVDSTSDPFRKASVEELDWFRNKREPAVKEKERILDRARGRAIQHFQAVAARHSITRPQSFFRTWTTPACPKASLASPTELRDTIRTVLDPIPHNPFTPTRLTPIAEGIFFDDSLDKSFKYQEASIQGAIYHEVGFWWDAQTANIVAVGAVANSLILALRIGLETYERLGFFGIAEVELQLHGVHNRVLAGDGFDLGGGAFRCRDNEVRVRARDSVQELTHNAIETAERMIRDVYWAFGYDVEQRVLSGVTRAAKQYWE